MIKILPLTSTHPVIRQLIYKSYIFLILIKTTTTTIIIILIKMIVIII